MSPISGHSDKWIVTGLHKAKNRRLSLFLYTSDAWGGKKQNGDSSKCDVIFHHKGNRWSLSLIRVQIVQLGNSGALLAASSHDL